MDAAGNVGTLAFTFIITDGTPPKLTVPPDQIVEAIDSQGAPVTYPAATATDEVTSQPTITYSATSGTTFALGTTTVTVTASDEAGNQATGTFKVTVRDSKPPVLTLPMDLVVDATGPDGAQVDYPAATAVDAVTAAPRIDYSKASGTQFPLGLTVVTVTATDAAGNASTAELKITVLDLTAPVVSGPFSPLIVFAGALPNYIPQGMANSYDAVGATNFTQEPMAGENVAPGVVTVTLRAKDAAGN
jgi:hypothetical protein